MRWPWSKRELADDKGAAAARAESEAKLALTRRFGDEVEKVAARHRALQRQNRFAAQIIEVFRGT